MFLFCDATRNKNAEVTYQFMDRVDDCLSVGPDVVDTFVQIENPSERLLRWSDVVAFRTEHDDGRTNVAKINRRAVRGLN